jgi:predicted transcriptional regulator
MAKAVKVTVNLSPQVVKALEALAEEEGITKTEALRKAISTEKFLHEEKKKGSRILIEDTDQKIREIIIR